MPSKEAHRSFRNLQPRNVRIQVHPVDAVEFERYVLAENVTDAICYAHGWLQLTCSQGHRRLSAQTNTESASAPLPVLGWSRFSALLHLVGLRRSLVRRLRGRNAPQATGAPKAWPSNAAGRAG